MGNLYLRSPKKGKAPAMHSCTAGAINNIFYSFTAPADTPVTRNLDNAKYRITIGTAMKIAPAANLVNSVSSRCISPTATVHMSLFFNKRFGRIKSLHGHANCVSAV